LDSAGVQITLFEYFAVDSDRHGQFSGVLPLTFVLIQLVPELLKIIFSDVYKKKLN
jgi:hypothetical protein